LDVSRPYRNIIGDNYHRYVKPVHPISKIITDLTGITNDKVAGADLFSMVANNFVVCMRGIVNDSNISLPIGVLVAHNGH
jgi:DNA polymerase III epsilon subunit-like protein